MCSAHDYIIDFVLDPWDYEVVPCKFVAPDEMRLTGGYTDYHGICLQQVEPACPLLNYALESGISIGNDDLAYVANHVTNCMPALASDAPRNESVRCIADVVFEADEEARTKFINAAGASQSSYFTAFFKFSKLSHRSEFETN